MKLKIILILSFLTQLPGFQSIASIPNMDIQFGGALAKSCSFVDNGDVASSIEATMTVLNNIQDVEKECMNILSNSKAFMQASLDNAVAMQTQATTSESNKETVSTFITDIINSGGTYSGEYNYELLTAQQEINLHENNKFTRQQATAHTLKLGATLFDQLKQASPACSHSFGKNLISPALAMTGQVYGIANPNIGLTSLLLQSIIEYGNYIFNDSYQALEDLQSSKNFHMTYKCTMKNIEDIICDLEEKERAREYAQENSEESDNFLNEYEEKIRSFDTDNENFKKYHHMKRHQYRISKIIEDLENIYRSPETATDLETVVSFQTALAGLANIPRQNPLKHNEYVRLMIEEGLAQPGELEGNWENWDEDKSSWGGWISYFGGNTFRGRIENLCKNIDGDKHPLLKNIYNANQSNCDYYSITKANVITEFIKVLVIPAIIEVQLEKKRINNKIKKNANIHALYNYIFNQGQNTGNVDYKEYSLLGLVTLFNEHAIKNENTSLKLYSKDVQSIMSAIGSLIKRDAYITQTYNKFVTATQEAYSKIAKVSNNGVEGGILYRSIIESKISSYLDGIYTNYLFNKSTELAENFVNYNFYIENYERLVTGIEKGDSDGSSNLPIMLEVKSAFLETFSENIAAVLRKNIYRYRKNKTLKRELIHSCAIFLPEMEDNFNVRWVLSNKIKRFCENLLEENKGIFIFQNAKDKFPLTTKDGLNFKNRCYYKEYEKSVIRFRINKAKRNRSRFRI